MVKYYKEKLFAEKLTQWIFTSFTSVILCSPSKTLINLYYIVKPYLGYGWLEIITTTLLLLVILMICLHIYFCNR